MFKKKISNEELTEIREKKYRETSYKLKNIIAHMDDKKDDLLSKVIEARRKGLAKQEKDARSLLKKCLATKKQVEGMLMTLELAVESRDLASTSQSFMESIGDLSKEIQVSNKKTNVKKTRKQYLKALYASKLQTNKIDEFLSLGDYDSVLSFDDNKGMEFDDEINSMIEDAEANVNFQGIKNKF